ncbi:hypothetical protein [Bradyrhizobium japonicum]|nr:hypothetical protein [Bradyrhizobium japonicum]
MNDEMPLEQIEALLDIQPGAKQVAMCFMMIARIAITCRFYSS